MNEPQESEVLAPDDALRPADEQARQLTGNTTHLITPVHEPPVGFEEAMDYVFHKNSELYGRLA